MANIQSEVRAGQRWTPIAGGSEIAIVGPATEGDRWCVTWSGGPRGGELWPTQRIVDGYRLAAEFRAAGTG